MPIINNFQTEIDFGEARELPIGRHVAQYLYPNSTVIKTAPGSYTDLLGIVDGTVRFSLEIKYRRVASTSFETIIWPLTKYRAAHALRVNLGLKTYGVMYYSDRVALQDFTAPPIRQADGSLTRSITRAGRSNAVEHIEISNEHTIWLDQIHPLIAADLLRLETSLNQK